MFQYLHCRLPYFRVFVGYVYSVFMDLEKISLNCEQKEENQLQPRSIKETTFKPELTRMVEKEAKESGEKDWKKLILYAVIIIAVVLAVFFLGFIAGWFGRGSSTETSSSGNGGTEEKEPTNTTIIGQVKVDRDYETEFSNPASTEFKNLSDVFCAEMTSIFGVLEYGYKDCMVDRLTLGSTIVEYRLIFEKTSETLLIKVYTETVASNSDLLLPESLFLTTNESECSEVCTAENISTILLAYRSVLSETCSDDTCLNGGKCSNTGDSCNCTNTGYNGTRCENAICDFRQLTDCSVGACSMKINCVDLVKTMDSITEAECVTEACKNDSVNTVNFDKSNNQCKLYHCPQQLGFQLQGSNHIYIRQLDYVTELKEPDPE